MEGATNMQDAQKRNGASGKGAASALISNLNALARVLRPVVTPERLLGWSLGIVYLWFGALKLAHLSPVLELIRRASPRCEGPLLQLAGPLGTRARRDAARRLVEAVDGRSGHHAPNRHLQRGVLLAANRLPAPLSHPH